jgi:hypothetical protein
MAAFSPLARRVSSASARRVLRAPAARRPARDRLAAEPASRLVSRDSSASLLFRVALARANEASMIGADGKEATS